MSCSQVNYALGLINVGNTNARCAYLPVSMVGRKYSQDIHPLSTSIAYLFPPPPPHPPTHPTPPPYSSRRLPLPLLRLALTYPTGAVAFASARFGAGSGAIFLDDVACVGTETRLEECRHRGIGTEDCSHVEDAGVRCGRK